MGVKEPKKELEYSCFFDTFCYRERKPKTPEGEDTKVYIQIS